jgi:hypothetical protein
LCPHGGDYDAAENRFLPYVADGEGGWRDDLEWIRIPIFVSETHEKGVRSAGWRRLQQGNVPGFRRARLNPLFALCSHADRAKRDCWYDGKGRFVPVVGYLDVCLEAMCMLHGCGDGEANGARVRWRRCTYSERYSGDEWCC